MKTNTNNQNTLNFIKILELNEYLVDELQVNLLNRFTLFNFEDEEEPTIIDLLTNIVELHKEKDYFDFTIFNLDATTVTIEDEYGDEHTLDIDNYLEVLCELYPDLKIDIREDKLKRLLVE